MSSSVSRSARSSRKHHTSRSQSRSKTRSKSGRRRVFKKTWAPNTIHVEYKHKPIHASVSWTIQKDTLAIGIGTIESLKSASRSKSQRTSRSKSKSQNPRRQATGAGYWVGRLKKTDPSAKIDLVLDDAQHCICFNKLRSFYFSPTEYTKIKYSLEKNGFLKRGKVSILKRTAIHHGKE